MDEIDKVVNRLYNIASAYGIITVVLILVFAALLFFFWKFIGKAAERAAEVTADKSLIKFQSHIDQELHKFQIKHQKQVDAVHNVYQAFQKLTRMIHFIVNGEKFTRPTNPTDDINTIVGLRHRFKVIFNENRLIFSIPLGNKIDEIIIIVDDWIETYASGILPQQNEPAEEEVQIEGQEGLFVAGIWALSAFDEIENKFNTIREEIENEFRKIYGTTE